MSKHLQNIIDTMKAAKMFPEIAIQAIGRQVSNGFPKSLRRQWMLEKSSLPTLPKPPPAIVAMCHFGRDAYLKASRRKHGLRYLNGLLSMSCLFKRKPAVARDSFGAVIRKQDVIIAKNIQLMPKPRRKSIRKDEGK
ncbi:MAG: hypothetical protein Q8O31_06830 [Rhodocyclaceae bacterium]|nr:hypothetical protein [Rhodocyclaceae bacterium]